MLDTFSVPFVHDSDTSEAAADSMEPSVSRLRRLVLLIIKQASAEGRTCDEVEVIARLRHQTASARVRELALAKLIVDSGDRRPTRTGRSARVYLLTDKGAALCSTLTDL